MHISIQVPPGAIARETGRRLAAPWALTVALVALGLMAGAAAAGPPAPVIDHVLIEEGLLTIRGENLDLGGDPIVKLGPVPLAVQDSSAEAVRVELPAQTAAGQYFLTLRRPEGGPTAKVAMTVGIAQRIPLTPFFGLVIPIAGNNGSYVFAGPAGSVTLSRPQQRLVGAATAPLGLAAGAPPQTADVGLCYQADGVGPIVNFLGSNYAVHNFTTSRASYSATASTVVSLPPGTYTVGMCVRNNGPNTISNNNYVNGWVMVLD